MISLDLAKEVLELALRKGAESAIVRLQRTVSETITFENGALRQYSTSVSMGLGIRVRVGGVYGYAYTTSFDRESIERAIERALAMARSGRRRISMAERVGSVARLRYRTEIRVDPFQVDPDKKVALVRELNRDSMKIPEIKSAVTRFGARMDHRIVVNSEGAEAESIVYIVGLGHVAVAKTGEIAERVGDSESAVAGYEFIESRDWRAMVSEINELAIRASQAKTPTPGTYRAVIDNKLIGLLIHEAFGHASEGDEVMNHVSVLEGKLGTRVASELVTVIDDGMVEGGYPVPFDDEGSIKSRTVVVDHGILKSYLTGRREAAALGMEVTGNARAADYSYDTLVRQTNYFVAPGDWDPEEMIRDMREGMYLRGRGARGGQVEPSIGTFTFSIGPSYIVRNGEPVELVRGVNVSGNILETLAQVDAVGKDLKIETSVFGYCGKFGQAVPVGDGGPHIRVQRIVVGGG